VNKQYLPFTGIDDGHHYQYHTHSMSIRIIILMVCIQVTMIYSDSHKSFISSPLWISLQ